MAAAYWDRNAASPPGRFAKNGPQITTISRLWQDGLGSDGKQIFYFRRELNICSATGCLL